MYIACTSLCNIRQYSVLSSVKRVIIYCIQSCVQDRDMVKCTPSQKFLVIFSEIIWDTGYVTGMAYRLNFTDNGLPIFDQSRLPITDILSVLSFTDTDNRYSRNCRHISVLPIYRGKITKIQPIFRADIWPKLTTDSRYFIGPDIYRY